MFLPSFFCHSTFVDQGGNNTVAVARGFGEVRAVEINKRLAEAAEEPYGVIVGASEHRVVEIHRDSKLVFE